MQSERCTSLAAGQRRTMWNRTGNPPSSECAGLAFMLRHLRPREVNGCKGLLKIVRHFKLNLLLRARWIHRHNEDAAHKCLRLEIPSRHLGRPHSSLTDCDDKEPLANEYAKHAEILRHCEKTRIIRPYEARIAPRDVQPLRQTERARGGIAHGNFVCWVDTCHKLAVW
jgi:hypothetical protein